MQQFYWENGERVPAYDPRKEDTTTNSIESNELVVMRQLVSFLSSSPNPALSIKCLCLVSGICYDGKSMAAIARTHKVSRATVSKRCVDLCDAFGLQPTRAMRSKKGRANCRSARGEQLLKLIS
jgi:hypothetical protein